MAASENFEEHVSDDKLNAGEGVWRRTEEMRLWCLSYLRAQFGSTLTHEDLEDAVQEAFVGFWQYQFNRSEIQNPLGLLTSIARRRCIDQVRRRSGFIVHELPAELLAKEEQSAEVLDLLALLPDPQRKIVTLRFVEGLKFQEIANLLRLSLATVFGHCASGVRMLREHSGLASE